MQLPRLRLAHQISLLIAAAVVLAVVVVGTLSALNLRSGFRDYLQARDDEQLMRLVALLEQRSANDPHLQWLRGEPEPMRSVMDAFNGRTGRPRRGPEGAPPDRPPLRDGTPPRADRRPPPAERDNLGDRLIIRDSQGETLAGRFHPEDRPRTVRAIKVDGVEVAFVELMLEPAPEGLDARFLQLQTRRLVWAALAAIGLSVLAAWWLAGRWSRPLIALQKATQAMARGRGAPALKPSGAMEIAQLVENVNHMGQELDRLDKARRLWIAQISHELRTPLSVLRGEMEAIEDGARQPTPEVMRGLQAEVLQLGRLVDDLHTVSVADMGGLHCTLTGGDAHAWLWRVAHGFEGAAAKRGLTLALPAQLPARGDAHLPVQWDFGRIEQLLANLITNSMRYTDAPGHIAVNWHKVGDVVVLTVDDSKPGVSGDDLKELFEPLFRADRARQRSNDGGSGLGLAIVRSIAQAHGGSVQASHADAGGLRITVRLPTHGKRSAT
jgi:two-component system sensor histidine kinase BaeS